MSSQQVLSPREQACVPSTTDSLASARATPALSAAVQASVQASRAAIRRSLGLLAATAPPHGRPGAAQGTSPR